MAKPTVRLLVKCDERCQFATDEEVEPTQEAIVSSSIVPRKCESASKCENGVETKITVESGAIATISTQTETETDTYELDGLNMQEVSVLQSTVQQMVLQMAEISLINSTVNAMKTSIDCMMNKIDDLTEKLNALGQEKPVRLTQARRVPVYSLSGVEMTEDDCTESEVLKIVDGSSKEKDEVVSQETVTSLPEVVTTMPKATATPEDGLASLLEVVPNPQDDTAAPLKVIDANTAASPKVLASQTKVATAIPLTRSDSKSIISVCSLNTISKLQPPKTPEELNKRLLPPLKKIIHQKVKYDEVEAKHNIKIMMETVTGIVDAMKATNPLFKDLFKKTGYTGSYYDGLRIFKANEFDLNLVMRLPFPSEDVELEASTEPAFVRYRLKRELEMIFGMHPKWTKELYQQFKPLFDEERYLMRDKWQNWCQKVITVAWEKFENPEEVSKVTRHPNQCGPAITLKIVLQSSSKSIDVDLVPVLDGVPYPTPAGLEKSDRLKKLGNEAQAWYLVPKPLKGDKFTQYEVKRCWRISFPEAEKGLLENLGIVKPLIKLFKLLRDVERWPIPSYFIKSIFLLELDTRSDLESWQEIYMGIRFIEMMEQFRAAMKVPFIPYYFNRNANLLSGMDKAVAEPISNRLGKLKTRLSSNPENIITVFKVDADK